MERSSFRYFYPLNVRYNEVDAQGIVFNAHYLTWYDMAVSAYIRAAGWDNRAEVKASGADWHVVRALVEYKVGIGHDEELAIGVRTTRIGNSSIAFQPAIYHSDGDRMLATGEIVWVWTDQKSKRPIPVPDRLRALLTRFDAA